MKKNPIGTAFKKENIFLATVDCPIAEKELEEVLQKGGCRVTGTPGEKNILDLMVPLCTRQEYDIFYKDGKGYTRFLLDGNETFAGDGSDGKGKLYNIVSAWNFYEEAELSEVENNAGEPAILDESGGNDKLERYNRVYNMKK